MSHITLLIIHLNDNYELDDSFREAFSQFPTTAIVTFFCLVVAGFVSKLLLYHIKIICKSESTYEEKKKHFKDTLFNPYKRSFCHNLFCKKRPPKFYDLTELEPPKPEDSNRTLSMKTVSGATFRESTNFMNINKSTRATDISYNGGQESLIRDLGTIAYPKKNMDSINEIEEDEDESQILMTDEKRNRHSDEEHN